MIQVSLGRRDEVPQSDPGENLMSGVVYADQVDSESHLAWSRDGHEW